MNAIVKHTLVEPERSAVVAAPSPSLGSGLSPLSAESLIAKAIEHQVPIETMERLLAMRKELKAEQAREAFYRALSGFQAACPVIPKTKTAEVLSRSGGSYRYSYAPLEGIVKVIAPLLQQYGLSFTVQTRLEQEPLSQVAVCTVHHVDGHSESSEFRAPIDQGARMNEMQKAASAQTYAKRYALCNALGILTGDEDDDAQAVNGSAQVAPNPVSPMVAVEGSASAPAPEAANRPAPSPRPLPSGRQNQGRTTIPDTRPGTEAPLRRLEARIRDFGVDRERVKRWVKGKWSLEHFEGLNRSQYEELDRNLEDWAKQVKADTEAETARRQRTLQEARRHGWDGNLESLPALVERLRATAKRTRSQAQYAEGRTYFEEMNQATATESLAGRLALIAKPALSRVEGPALSCVEGPALSRVEGEAQAESEPVAAEAAN